MALIMIQLTAAPPVHGPAIRSSRTYLAVATLLIAVSIGLSGCVYRMTVQQGNFLDPKQVSQLQTGMTRAQVRFLLGTPVLPDAFDKDRWDYLYYLKTGRLKGPDQRRLSVFFADDKVARVENIGVASAPAVAGAGPPLSGAAAPAVAAPATTVPLDAAPGSVSPPSGQR